MRKVTVMGLTLQKGVNMFSLQYEYMLLKVFFLPCIECLDVCVPLVFTW